MRIGNGNSDLKKYSCTKCTFSTNVYSEINSHEILQKCRQDNFPGKTQRKILIALRELREQDNENPTHEQIQDHIIADYGKYISLGAITNCIYRMRAGGILNDNLELID